MARVRKKEADMDRLQRTDFEDLMAFNVTKQRIVDLCNEEVADFPWEKEIDYSSWHRALDGKESVEFVVKHLEDLLNDQTRNPRKYLPDGPPPDDLAPWMKQVAGLKWWHGVLQPKCTLNVLNGWGSGRSMRQDQLEDLKQRVADWWERVEAACAQADMVRRVDACERASRDAESWDTLLRDYIDDGHTVDEAREHYVALKAFRAYHSIEPLNLCDPKPVARPMQEDQVATLRALDEPIWRREFDAMQEAGFPRAVPKTPPELQVWEKVKRWPDRRSEEGPKDVNDGLYGLWYRERVEQVWDAEARRVDEVREIVAVSTDGETWREPTGQELRGWIVPSLEIARYRAEHGESPDNSYCREVAEAEQKLRDARRAYNEGFWREDRVEELESRLRAAEAGLSAAREDY